MTATVRVYKSTDTSAPVLTGQVGSLIALLDACLVNGYGSSTAAGWTKPYTGTNLAVFYMGAGTPRMYLRVDDTAAQEGRIVGYESMSGISTGTGDFPTAAQQSGGLFVRKSNSADATARPWLLIACERAVYFWAFTVQTIYGNSSNGDGSFGFGAFASYKSGDAFNCFVNAATLTGTAQSRLGQYTAVPLSGSILASPGFFVSRAYTQIGLSINPAKMVPAVTTANGATTSTMGLNVGGAYPDPITGGLRLARVLVCENDGGGKTAERGYLPGMWSPMHNLPASFFDTFGGTGSLAGKSFLLPPTWSQTAEGRCAFEVAGSWDL